MGTDEKAGEAADFETPDGQDWLRLLLEGSPLALGVATEGVTRYANPAFLRLFGYDHLDEIRGRPLFELLAPEEREAMQERICKEAAGDAENTYETRGVRRDSSCFHDRIVAWRVVSPFGPATMALHEDVSDQKQAQEALRASATRFRELIEKAPFAIGIHRDGVPVYANPEHLRMFGFANEQATAGVSLLDLVAPESRAMVADRIHRRVAGLTAESDYELVALRQDGTRFPCQTRVIPVELADGPAAMVFHSDLTESRRAMEAVCESEERFRALLQQSAEGVVVLDDTGGITEWNVAMEQVTGVRRKDALGRPLWDVASELAPRRKRASVNHAAIRARILAVIGEQTRTPTPEEALLQRGDGELRTIEYSTFSILVGGRTNLGILVQDITERKRAEQARARTEQQIHQAQKMEALGTLSGGIAHDFNNMLMAIMANAELLMEQLPPDGLERELASEVLAGSVRARDLVRQILLFARPKDPARTPQQLTTIVAEALKLLYASLPASIAIQWRPDPRAAPVLADPTQIHQVVTNLATNAAHAMAPQGGRLTLTVAPFEATAKECAEHPDLIPGRFTRLTIEDTGAGMAPETLVRIFEPFFTTKPLGQGTGLGLSIVHGIVTSHEGFITVQSTEGKGTAFHLHFPEHVQPLPVSVPAPKTPMPAASQARRVLVVDDEASVVRVTVQMLAHGGFDATGVTTPREALDLLRANPDAFDVAIVDLAMPGMYGTELAGQILALHPGLPILLASGNTKALDFEDLRALGIREVLSKPYRLKALLGAVERATQLGS